MESQELQEEELEVLASIYDGDPNFKQISSNSFQYKIGADEDPKSFLLEVSWVKDYPNVAPKISLDAFYNNKLIPEVKSDIIKKLQKEADLQIGTAMTYTLFEWARDNAEELMKLQPDKVIPSESESPMESKASSPEEMASKPKKEKKPQLSKQQKRRLADRVDAKGERPRGWDWVDIIKHLSQVGSKQTSADS